MDDVIIMNPEDKPQDKKVQEEPLSQAAEEVSPEGNEPQASAKDPQPESWWRGVVEFLVAFVVMVGIIFGLRVWVIEPFQIPSGSMLQTIQIGDRVFSEKISKLFWEYPASGDIITFTNPRDPSETLIKRCIAHGGQTIDIRDGGVYIDGELLDEPYTGGQKTYTMRCDGKVQKTNIEYPYTIPEGYVWCMGDNRGNSADCRVFGPVKVDTISGVANFRYWPIFRKTDAGFVLSVGFMN